jgi:ferric-dicitrate binding protein FerR (iron transport regulator)
MDNMMAQENYMNGLLSGFYSVTLTSKEKSDLYHYLINDRYKDAIMSWLQEQWDNGLWQTGDEIPSEAMLEKIKMEIEEYSAINDLHPEGRKIHFIQKLKGFDSSKSINYGKIFLRYAAVILFTFGLSWIVLKTMTRYIDKDIMAETSLQYNEIYVPYGSKTKVILPDNSTVWLNSGARLRHPVNFNDNQRYVYLEGEGFFEIIKDSQHPFVVYSNGMNITVLGTKFNVLAYADDQLIETTLVEGAIEIQWLKDVADKQSNASLKPGQKLTLRKENEQYEFQDIQETGLSIAWMEDRLVFAKERFGDAKIKLERWYGVTVEVFNPEILDYQITGTFEKQTLEQAMAALSIALACQFKIDKNLVTVSK